MKSLIFIMILLATSVSQATVFFGAPVTGTAGASAQVLGQNNLRSYLIIQNTGATSIIVKLGSTISSSNEGVQIPAGGNYEPIKAPANAVFLKALSGSPTYILIEGN